MDVGCGTMRRHYGMPDEAIGIRKKIIREGMFQKLNILHAAYPALWNI
jgi:hypothetical protein